MTPTIRGKSKELRASEAGVYSSALLLSVTSEGLFFHEADLPGNAWAELSQGLLSCYSQKDEVP